MLRGRFTQGDVTRAVVPLGGLVVTARAREVTGGRELDLGGAVPPAAPLPGAPTPGAAPPPPLAPTVAPGAADFVHQGLRPDIAYYVTPDDQLVVGVRNSQAGVSLAAAARLWIPGSGAGLDLNAPWPIASPIGPQILEGYAGTSTSITPSTDRSLGLTPIQLAQGYLTGVAVRATAGAPQRGQCLVSLYLARGVGGGLTTYQLLGQDYVTAQTGVGWPGGRAISGVEGPGQIKAIIGAQPPVGTDMRFTVPTGARWRVWLFGGHFRTSAVVANRLPRSLIIVSGNPLTLTNGISQAQTVDTDYQWVSGLPLIQIAGAPDQLWLPPEIILGPGDAVGTNTVNLDAGDQWSGIYIYLQEVIQD